jgi:hypothetical protein
VEFTENLDTGWRNLVSSFLARCSEKERDVMIVAPCEAFFMSSEPSQLAGHTDANYVDKSVTPKISGARRGMLLNMIVDRTLSWSVDQRLARGAANPHWWVCHSTIIVS